MATFLAGDGVGVGSVDATLDNATVTASITIVAASTLKMVGYVHLDTPSSDIITFSGVPGTSYVIQSTPSLSEPWSDLAPAIVPDATGLGICTNVNPPAPQFYRARSEH